MVRYYRDPYGTQVLSSNNKTLASQNIHKVSKQESSDVDGLKQRVKELEDLLNKHNVSTSYIAKLLNLYCNPYTYCRFPGVSVKMFN